MTKTLKKRILHWFRDHLVGLAARVYMLYYKTIRFEIHGWDEVERHMAQEGAVIFGHLHGDDLAMLYPFGRRGLTVMVSLSQDGDALALAMETVGFDTVRGSSSRRGREALRNMERVVRSGKSVIFTVDGPSGPRARVKAGIAMLAKRTQAPVFVGYTTPGRGFMFKKTWHRTYIPYPFTKVRFDLLGPFRLARRADSEAFEAFRANLERRLAGSGMAGSPDEVQPG